MSKFQPKHSQNIWLPLNRKSQILATITALVAIVFQIYFWHGRLVHPQPSHNTSTPHVSENQGR
jgi:hypothetical protein